MGDDLKKKMLNALTWTTIDRFGQQVVQFVIGLILARLLSPSDFGLLGMVMIFSALSFVLVESGFGQALIRKQDANETDFNTIFYFNIFTSLLLYLILFFSTPTIAIFFKQPLLIPLGRVVFLAILFNAMYLVPFTKLVKEMDFKTLAKANILSTVLSGICGVILAFLHFGVWALVAQQALYHFFRMITFHMLVKWRPQRLFSFEVIQNFWKFSVHLLSTSVLNVIFNNLYILLLSRFYPVKQVGYYSQANKLSETFNFTFQQILLGSTFTLFTQVQNDNARLRRIYREVGKKTALITFPIMLILIAIANPFISVLLSSKWLPTSPYFQLLCLASLFTPFYALNMSALNARGQSKTTFKIEIYKKCLITLSVIISFSFGIMAMLWGYSLACFVSYLISAIYIKKDIQHFIFHQIRDILPGAFIGGVIAILTFSLCYIINKPVILLISQGALATFLYLIIIKISQPELYGQAISLISEKIKLVQKKQV